MRARRKSEYAFLSQQGDSTDSETEAAQLLHGNTQQRTGTHTNNRYQSTT
jgi:hypothetical protein